MKKRSMALVVREDKILMVKQHLFGRDFFILPGGGVEEGETPAEAALRELWEECGVRGEILRPLAANTCADGKVEHTFLVGIPDSAKAIVGKDPELADDQQIIVDVQWKNCGSFRRKTGRSSGHTVCWRWRLSAGRPLDGETPSATRTAGSDIP